MPSVAEIVSGLGLDLDAARKHRKARQSTRECGIDAAIPEGERHDVLLREAGRLRQSGSGDEELRQRIHGINALRCKPPMSLADVETIVNSAMSWENPQEGLVYIADGGDDGEDDGSPIDGATALDAVVNFAQRFVLLDPACADVVALWSAFTHIAERFPHAPYLHVKSATMGAGKSTLADIVALLVARALLLSHTTAAALVRAVDRMQPTLIIDEFDAIVQGNHELGEELRGLLNAGSRRRTGFVMKCAKVGKDFVPTRFRCYGPKLIAGIGKLWATVADRCIEIPLERAKPGETEKFRDRPAVLAEAESIRKGLERFAKRVAEAALEAQPALPTGLDARAEDIVEPLLALADLAGGDWPERARAAIVKLVLGRERDADDQGVALLRDIRHVFEIDGAKAMFSTQLIARLHNLPESPWSDKRYGERVLTPSGLAERLKLFGIRSRTVRIGNDVARGYKRDWFERVWARTLPPLDVDEPEDCGPAPDGILLADVT